MKFLEDLNSSLKKFEGLPLIKNHNHIQEMQKIETEMKKVNLRFHVEWEKQHSIFKKKVKSRVKKCEAIDREIESLRTNTSLLEKKKVEIKKLIKSGRARLKREIQKDEGKSGILKRLDASILSVNEASQKKDEDGKNNILGEIMTGNGGISRNRPFVVSQISNIPGTVLTFKGQNSNNSNFIGESQGFHNILDQ